MSRHYAPHQSQTADTDVLLHTRKSASSEHAQREIAPLTAADLNLTQLPRARQQTSAIALSRVAGNRATAQLVQRCASCGGKDEDTVQRSLFDNVMGGANSVVNSASAAENVASNSGAGSGFLGGIAETAQNAANSATNAAEPGQSMMDETVGAAQNAASNSGAGSGLLGGIAETAQNAANSANNAAQPGQSMMDDSVGAAQNAAASASSTVGNLFNQLF
jgi:hypothetical protein